MDKDLRVATAAAKVAGKHILTKFFKKALKIERKKDTSIVTQADKESNIIILRALRSQFPTHDIVSEESEQEHKGSVWRWYVDPLDGTTNFARQIPVWCVSIGLWKGGKPYLGVIYDPEHDELFYAKAGKGAFLNGRRIRSSRTSDTDNMTIDIVGTRSKGARSRRARYYAHLFRKDFLPRFNGSSALAVANVAAGRYDASVISEVHAWDIAAGIVIAAEAGAKMYTLREGDEFLGGDYIIAGSGKTLNMIKKRLG